MPSNENMTATTYYQGVQWLPTTPEQSHTPKGLLVTRAVETKSGWVGQVIVDKVIVWESAVYESQDEAVETATQRTIARLRKLFA